MDLDALVREVAAHGVFVSAHPGVVQKMGTKEVLYRTRALPWGTDSHLWRSADELMAQFPAVLRLSGPRVLKQDRGSGGNGAWKVELIRAAEPAAEAMVRVQPATRGAAIEEVRWRDFVAQRAAYFSAFGGTGCFVDQPYAERLAEGMIRCYLVHDRVAGFGHQFVTALLPPPPGTEAPPDPPPRLYYGPAQPKFERFKALLESGWVAELQRLLDVDRGWLPVIWDADFLLGPKMPSGRDSYALCEVNVGGVFPIPDESAAPIAEATLKRALAAKRARRA